MLLPHIDALSRGQGMLSLRVKDAHSSREGWRYRLTHADHDGLYAGGKEVEERKLWADEIGEKLGLRGVSPD